ncbi:MAG: zinc ribbon domain-containing protein [Candidatus Muiribacteriota bacterium]
MTLKKSTLILRDNNNNPICQSCSLPISDEKMRGTNLDGSLSDEYCTLCYFRGSFREPEIEMSEVIDAVAHIVANMRDFDIKKARLITGMTLPRLKRWQMAEEDSSNPDKYVIKKIPKISIKWNEILETCSNIVLDLVARDQMLFAGRLRNCLNHIEALFFRLFSYELELVSYREVVNGFESLKVVLNLCMERKLMFEKDYVYIVKNIKYIETIFKKVAR